MGVGVYFKCNTTNGRDVVRGSVSGVDFGSEKIEKQVRFCDGKCVRGGSG